VEYPATADRALERLLQCVEPGDLVVTMGAGDVTELAPRILAGLASR
jgi:UDP-N-acetylmuramate--alanine ligase